MVKNFLKDCGNEFLQELLIPSRLDKAMKALDTDGSGVIEIEEWEEAIEKALQVRLAQIAEERARKRAEARKARDKLAAEVLVLARQVFAMLDVDDGGTLSRDEIVRGVEEDEEVVKFLINCGNEFLAALLKPKKLEKALIEIDTDGSGEVDLEEWEAAVLAGLEKRLQAMAEAFHETKLATTSYTPTKVKDAIAGLVAQDNAETIDLSETNAKIETELGKREFTEQAIKYRNDM